MLRLKKEDSSDSLLNNGPRSEYVKRYPEHPINRAKSYKPSFDIVKSDTPIESVTVNKRDYQEHPIERRHAYKPNTDRVELDPFVGNTSNRDEYPEWQLPEKRVREKLTWIPPVEPVESINSQKRDYPEHPTPRRQIYKPDNTRDNLAPFEGQPSYRENYPEWQLPEKVARQKVEWEPPAVPIDGTSTNMTDFQQHQISPRTQAFRPDNRPVHSDVPFTDSTDYKDTFKPHNLPPKQVRQKAEWTKPLDPFDSTTTMAKDFQGIYQPPQASMRPAHAAVSSDMPLETDTTTNISYQPHVIERVQQVRRQNEYEKPEGHMESTTTNMATYKENFIEKPRMIKPGSSHLLQGRGEMSHTTTTGHYYQQPPLVKREVVKRRDGYQPPTVPLDTNTTVNMTYKQHDVGPRKMYKPDGQYIKNDAPFMDSTEIKDRYTEHILPPKYVKQKEEHKPPSAAFDARTTTNQSYIGPYQPKRESFHPDKSVIKSDLPFQSDTTFGASFKPWHTEPRQRPKPAEYNKPDGYMDFSTVNRETYKEVQGERPSMRKLGDSSLLTAAGKFEGSTSYSSDFIQKDMSNRKMMRPDNDYIAPTIPFDNTTTYRNAHIGYVQPKERSRRPNNMSDVLGQRDKANRYHIRGHDWREQLTIPATEVSA